MAEEKGKIIQFPGQERKEVGSRAEFFAVQIPDKFDRQTVGIAAVSPEGNRPVTLTVLREDFNPKNEAEANDRIRDVLISGGIVAGYLEAQVPGDAVAINYFGRLRGSDLWSSDTSLFYYIKERGWQSGSPRVFLASLGPAAKT